MLIGEIGTSGVQGMRLETDLRGMEAIFRICGVKPLAFFIGVFNGFGIDCFNLNQRADVRETFLNMRYLKLLK